MTKLAPIAWLAACCFTAAGQVNAETTPTDVFELALAVEAEIDLIRLEMGVADVARPDIAIAGAQPREVYFQALTLYEKSNRLLFEQSRERDDPPNRKSADLTPDDVLRLVKGSHALILRTKQTLGIVDKVKLGTPDITATPTDVYKLIVRLNRSLNSLLQQRFSPAEVYQQVTYGVGLMSAILATVASGDRLGVEPALVRRKTPVEVYRKLISIYSIVHGILAMSGDKCLAIEPAENERDDVTPSDVYDMASLLVAQLSYLHSLAPGAEPAKGSYYPGNKLPSHAYQRAGRLESQVKALHRYVSRNADWLRR